jgi:hypothetical protein
MHVRDPARARAATPCSARVALLCIAVLTGGCTTIYQGGGPPTVMLDTVVGPPAVIAGGPLGAPPGGALAAPPEHLAPAGQPPFSGGSLDGAYSGMAVPLNTYGGVCIQDRPVTGFTVRGGSVRWGRITGRIAPNGGLQMVSGETWVTGYFAGDTFHGQIALPGRFGAPGCSYMMTLRRSGA